MEFVMEFVKVMEDIKCKISSKGNTNEDARPQGCSSVLNNKLPITNNQFPG